MNKTMLYDKDLKMKKIMDDPDIFDVEDVPLEAIIPQKDRVLPDPFLLSFYNDIRERILYIDTELSRETLIEHTKLILAFNREDAANHVKVEDRKPIKLFIYSYGGDVDSVLHFTDICLLSKTPIYTYNMGVAMSGGFYLMLAGSKRFALKNSKALYHSGGGGVQGTYEQVQAQNEQYKKDIEHLRDFILQRTKIDNKKLKAKKEKEWYIDANEQIELGIVDELVTDISALL